MSLPKAERLTTVVTATEAGVSGQALAAALGVSVGTISGDKAALGLSGGTVTGADGRTTKAKGSAPMRTHAEPFVASVKALATKITAVTNRVDQVRKDGLLSPGQREQIADEMATTTELFETLASKAEALTAGLDVLDTAAIAAWMQSQGYTVSARGQTTSNASTPKDHDAVQEELVANRA